MTNDEAAWFADSFDRLVRNIEQAVVGKTDAIKLTLTCLLTGGHMLLEDVPGTGKTSLARSLARSVRGKPGRIQFTPDLLPSDVTGSSVIDPTTREFTFRQGPVFCNILLADEINRASPKTQSALLEVMEEGQVTVDGVGHRVGSPFMVIATQNPIEQAGTYRLPEAQLDRFLMKTKIGYPDHQSTVDLLRQASTTDRTTAVEGMITTAAVTGMADLAKTVHVDPAVLNYISTIAHESREAKEVTLGLSVRGCLAYVRAAKTWAAAHGRTFVLADDVKKLATPILCHRVILDAEAEFSGATVAGVIDRLLREIPPPQTRAA